MSICVVSDFLPGLHPTWGGAEVACERISRLVEGAGERVFFITTPPAAEVPDDIDLEPVDTCARFTGSRIDFELKNLIPLDPIVRRGVRRILRRRRPRVVHLQRASQLSLSVVQAAHDLGIPVVFSLYDLWMLCPLGTLLRSDGSMCTRYHGAHCARCMHPLKGPLVAFRRTIFDRVLPKIARFVCLSSTVVEQLADYGVPRDRLTTLPLPLFDRIDAPEARPRTHTLLFGGWTAPTKGLHVVVEALPRVKEVYPDVRLDVMETGAVEPYRTNILGRIDALGLADNVRMLGKQSPDEVKRRLAETSAVVVADQWGIAWPIFLTEAMAFARAIVASRVGDIPDFIIDGETGHLADRREPASFAEGILRVFADADRADALGHNARRRILEMCDEDRITRRLLDCYDAVRRPA